MSTAVSPYREVAAELVLAYLRRHESATIAELRSAFRWPLARLLIAVEHLYSTEDGVTLRWSRGEIASVHYREASP